MKRFFRVRPFLFLILTVPCLSSPSFALEVELNMNTELFSSEADVFNASKQISNAITNGEYEEALAEAFLECPEDNTPSFQVNYIRLNTLWLVDSTSQNDKRYSGIINYVLKCKHDRRRGGDR